MRVLRGGNVSLCLQILLYTIVVIKLFRKNENPIKFSEKKEKAGFEYFGRKIVGIEQVFVQKMQKHSIMLSRGDRVYGMVRHRSGFAANGEVCMQTYTKMRSRKYPDVVMKVIPGHFVTSNSHINYYIDMTTMKTRQNEAKAAAKAIASTYMATTIVDTIVCMDGMEVIGAYLADELTQAGIMSMNAHQTIYVYSPEFLLLLASATTGATILRAGESINYYGGMVVGITAIFSAVNKVLGQDIHALYNISDLPDYRSYSAENCRLCRDHIPIDAICNSFGYSKLT